MMSQTLAIFHDAYRSLNAKKLFWIVLAISALVVVAFAGVGLNEKGLKIFVWQLDTHPLTSDTVEPAMFYKWLFATIGVGVWLTWFATILALVSTAGIFPDLLNSGSIDLMIAKPIGRLRLFLTQYAAGLLFVTLQVGIFSMATFLVLGLRAAAWEPSLFLAVPLVVCFFSYLFSVCTLVGLLTRSTTAALLLTMMFWFFVYGIGAAENGLLMVKAQKEDRAKMAIVLEAQETEDGEQVIHAVPPGARAKQEKPKQQDDEDRSLETAHTILYRIKTVLPKTTETVALLERQLIDLAELPEGLFGQPPEHAAATQEVVEEIRSRSVGWVVGTSLCFEAVVLALAGLVFCRRDY